MRRWLIGIATLLLAVALGVAAVTVSDATAQVPPPIGPPSTQPPPPAQPPPPPPDQPRAPRTMPAPSYPPLPEGCGQGRRIVYSVSGQRVWLVEGNEQPTASWLVSGRRGIPKPGTYRVFSRSRWSSANGG